MISDKPEKVDPVTTQVVFNRLQSTAEEMWGTLVRAAYSVNIKERHDCSAAIFTPAGEVVAMPTRTTVPIHLSSLDGVVQAVLHRFKTSEMAPGDMYIANDPYIPGGGGSHLPDFTVIAPVFGAAGSLVAFVANLGHHSDIGGAAPGSQAVHLPSIFHEGLRLPPLRIVRGGTVQDDIVDLIALNSRLPAERVGDLRAQIAANAVGARGVQEVCKRLGDGATLACMEEILAYTERRLRAALRKLPDGSYVNSDYLDNDGVGNEPLQIQVRVTKAGDSLAFDFAGTAAQAATAINVPTVGTRATVFCVVKTLLDPDLPSNAGLLRVISISAPEGSLVNPRAPAAVGERASSCQIIGDAVAGALAQVLPEGSCAGCGSHLSYRIYGKDPRTSRFNVEYQSFAGGHGATAFSDGMDSVRVWASGAANAPVEADEIAHPIIVHRYELRTDSAGAGQFRGGLGVRRVFTVYGQDVRISTGGMRRTIRARGIFGGEDGAPAAVTINPGTERAARLTQNVTDHRLAAGDVVQIESSGGGGWGEKQQRDPLRTERDVAEGKVPVEGAA